MGAPFLTTLSTIQCMHGGKATLTTSNTKASASNGRILVESDIHVVAGCAFTLPGPKPSPCIRIEWSSGASQVMVNGEKALTRMSVGQCYSPEGAVQGTAIIANTQVKASGQ